MSTPEIADLLDGQETLRTFKRFPLTFVVLVRLAEEQDRPDIDSSNRKVEALVTDISMSGLHLAAPKNYAEDSVLIVDITIGVRTFSLPVTVRRCTGLGRPGRYAYTYGCQYLKSSHTTDFVPALAKYLLSRGLLKAA